MEPVVWALSSGPAASQASEGCCQASLCEAVAEGWLACPLPLRLTALNRTGQPQPERLHREPVNNSPPIPVGGPNDRADLLGEDFPGPWPCLHPLQMFSTCWHPVWASHPRARPLAHCRVPYREEV